MGEIGDTAYIPVLIEAMGEDKVDFLCEEAMRALTKIGVPAQEALIKAWDSLDDSQQIFGIGVIEPVGGSGAIEFALEHFDRLIMSQTDLFCGLLEAVPDPRLLDRLKQVLHEQSPLIDQAYYLQARLLGSDDPEVEVVQKRVLAERERVSRTIMSFESGKFEPGPLILKLRCPACGAEHRYPTLGVVTPPSQTEGIPYLIADEYPCKSCHERVEFEFTQEAYGRLIPESLSLLTQPGQDLSDIRVKPMSCRLDNQVVPMALALQRLCERIAANPDDWVSHLKLGMILPALNRPRAAVTHLLIVIRQHPKAVDVVTLLASQLMRLGEMEQALTQLQAALACPGAWERYTPNGPGNRDFVDLYNELRRQLNRHDLPALHPSALEPPAKVGRNDPCPCGSGKKYKKCCLN
jgi:tetratricopeptide (TPR) repeat protein